MMNSYNEKIQEMINGSEVFIFMKGEPSRPMCRFSNAAMGVLRKYGVNEPGFFNVLEDDGMRQAIKEFSDWPTLPQIYVRGEFIGGADILLELDESGELGEIIGK